MAISKIQFGTITYDIDAVTLGGKTYQQIIDLVNTAQFVVATSAANTPKDITWLDGETQVTGTLEAKDADSNNIYLVLCTHDTSDNYDEYVAIKKGTTWAWEKIGNTDIDLSGYAKDGTYNTTAASNDSSGSSSAATVTSGESSAATITGNAKITYKLATQANSTGSDTTVNTNSAKPTITASFIGQESTLEHNVIDNGHSHTFNVATTTVYSSPASSGESGAHTHSVNSHTHGNDIGVVTGVTFTQGSAASLSKGTTTVIASASGNSSTIARVSGTMLVLAEQALTSLSTSTTSVVNSITFTPNTVSTFSSTTGTAASGQSAATLTALSAGAHTHSIARTSVTVATGGTISSSTTGVFVESHIFTPAGTVSASQDSHSHTYIKLPAHTHGITNQDAEASGTASVDISNHTHSVTIPSHTHTIAHTHKVIIS